MTRVIAAIDNSAAAEPVLAAAAAAARAFGAEVDAVHVVEDGHETADRETRAAALELRLLEGPTVDALVAAAQAEDVEALVLGTRGTPIGARPAGHTALRIVGAVTKPVMVVPPSCLPRPRLRRVLLPLQASRTTTVVPASMIDLAQDADLELIALHVHDESSLPRFTDQPQHETAAWADEFLARYCPSGIDSVRLELRVGQVEKEVLAAAAEHDVDAIALGWNRELRPGRAAVVREALAQCPVPLLLVPVTALVTAGVGA